MFYFIVGRQMPLDIFRVKYLNGLATNPRNLQESVFISYNPGKDPDEDVSLFQKSVAAYNRGKFKDVFVLTNNGNIVREFNILFSMGQLSKETRKVMKAKYGYTKFMYLIPSNVSILYVTDNDAHTIKSIPKEGYFKHNPDCIVLAPDRMGISLDFYDNFIDKQQDASELVNEAIFRKYGTHRFDNN